MPAIQQQNAPTVSTASSQLGVEWSGKGRSGPAGDDRGVVLTDTRIDESGTFSTGAEAAPQPLLHARESSARFSNAWVNRSNMPLDATGRKEGKKEGRK
jgi:hypothetical protein